MKEPHFVYDRRTQMISVGVGKSVSVNEFIDWCPNFTPPRGIDQLVYIPGIRASIHQNGTQSGVPELSRESDQTVWAKADVWIVKALELWKYNQDKARRKG